jgi:hypothetical protein
MNAPKDLLRRLFDAAIAAADPSVSLVRHLPRPPRGRTIVVGAGKAAASMARAVERRWTGDLSGLVVTRYGHAVPTSRIQVREAAHPVPDAAGLEAAREIMSLVCDLSADDLVLCLISGGGSAPGDDAPAHRAGLPHRPGETVMCQAAAVASWPVVLRTEPCSTMSPRRAGRSCHTAARHIGRARPARLGVGKVGGVAWWS